MGETNPASDDISTPNVPTAPDGVDTEGKSLVATVRTDGTTDEREMKFVKVISSDQWAAFGIAQSAAAFVGFVALFFLVLTTRTLDPFHQSLFAQVLGGVCGVLFTIMAIRFRVLYKSSRWRNSCRKK